MSDRDSSRRELHPQMICGTQPMARRPSGPAHHDAVNLAGVQINGGRLQLLIPDPRSRPRVPNKPEVALHLAAMENCP